MRKKQDINNLAEFEKWIDKTYGFVFADVKKFMEKSWCARGKYDRLKNKDLLNKQIIKPKADNLWAGSCESSSFNDCYINNLRSMFIYVGANPTLPTKS